MVGRPIGGMISLAILISISELKSLRISNFRRYLGVTAHWIDPQTFERQSCALACQRIRDRHTADVLASRILSIIDSNGLTGKIVTIVTDGGSNFVKAFKLKLLNEETPQTVENEIEMDNAELATDESEYEQEDDWAEETSENSENSIFQPNSMSDILYGDMENASVCLPPRTDCAAHKLNLVMTTDLKKGVTTEIYDNLYHPMMEKLNELWKKQNSSGRISDIIHQRIGRYFPTPVTTRWNSMFGSLIVFITLMEERPKDLGYIFDSLGILQLTSLEVSFLKEYLWVNISISLL